MSQLETELGVQVIVSTAVAIGTRNRIAIEQEIAALEYRINQLNGPGSEELKNATRIHSNRVREHMEHVANELIRLLTELKREWSRIDGTKPGKRRGRPAKK